MPITRFYEGENSWNMVSESGEVVIYCLLKNII